MSIKPSEARRNRQYRQVVFLFFRLLAQDMLYKRTALVFCWTRTPNYSLTKPKTFVKEQGLRVEKNRGFTFHSAPQARPERNAQGGKNFLQLLQDPKDVADARHREDGSINSPLTQEAKWKEMPYPAFFPPFEPHSRKLMPWTPSVLSHVDHHSRRLTLNWRQVLVWTLPLVGRERERNVAAGSRTFRTWHFVPEKYTAPGLLKCFG